MTDVVDLIMADHREVERLFDELKHHPEKRPLLVPVLSAVLTAHSRAEEDSVYPVARDEADEADEVAHSQEEHVEAEELLARLVATDPASARFDEVLEKLVEGVLHHVEEEESKVLPGMRAQLGDERRAELGRAFAESRARHMGDLPGRASRDELLAQARNAGVPGASGMSKQQLKQQLRSS
ncbi:hemerythrin domain-containing protein [Saccharothrix algeriensis]|uniref:Hemerythrin domain-containing protein n=1 Tax=Saccharothrix algeriensis TaxID=173560 RepID=A0A8T8I0J8_9PSEU|nr:hemerythrin domain-containing protein [Saccharothrix algeriensis]MBM7810098.1 hemerythrin superfamily protein [Saccharothrix algeriensis]QTR04312.1 hemerythrin domain-containing protein [Saccharothrix algeriensis]